MTVLIGLVAFFLGVALGVSLCLLLGKTFEKAASQVLNQNHQHFLQLEEQRTLTWQHLVDPLKQSLNKLDTQVLALEVKREGAYGALKEQVYQLLQAQHKLSKETELLAKALYSHSARGKWGEIQLKRLVELSGMLSHCDFFEQKSLQNQQNEIQRPDMVIRLPGSRHIIVDAKVPLSAYLQALECTQEAQKNDYLIKHAEQLKKHIQILNKKSYWASLEGTPEFVVLFLPGDVFLQAALSVDPELLEWAFSEQVILATPSTLMGLLKSIAYGWKQESIAQNAKDMGAIAAELLERVGKLTAHLDKLGKNLAQSVNAYNDTLGTLQTRILSTAKKLAILNNHAADSLKSPEAISVLPKEIKEGDSP